MNEEMLGNISQDMLFAMVRKEAKLDAACKAANAARTGHRRMVKAMTGVNTQNFLAVCKMINARDNGAEFIENLAEQKRLAERLDVPVGYQFDIIDELTAARRRKKANEDSDQPATRPFQEGVRASLRGEPETECPHDGSSKAFQEWTQGWRFADENANKGDASIEKFEEEEATDEEEGEADEDETEE